MNRTFTHLRVALAALLTLLPLVTTFSVPASAQSLKSSIVADGRTQPDCVLGPVTFTATGTSSSFDNRTKLCTVWTFAYYSTGFSVDAIALQEAPDSSGVAGSFVTWPAAQILNGQFQPLASITSASLTAYGYFPWINLNATTLTGTGTVVAYAYGWRASRENDASRAPASFSLVDGQKSTYRAVSVALNAGTGATTDIFTLKGSATKTIRVTKITVSATASTAAAYFDLRLLMRSAADTSGTPTTPTVVPLDSNSAAGTAVPNGWTAAPTAGTLVGVIDTAKLFAPITATAALLQSPIVFQYGSGPAQGIVLRGATQQLALDLNAVTPANAQAFDISIEWTEE